MSNTIVSVEDVMSNGRPISKNIDSGIINAYIREAEDLYVKPAIGQALYVDILNNVDNYADLLNGSTYCDGEKKQGGLKAVVAYYVQGLLVRYNNIQTTRFRAVEKTTEYGSNPAESSLNAQYNNLMGIADKYLNEVLDYLDCGDNHLYCRNRGSVRPRLKISIIK